MKSFEGFDGLRIVFLCCFRGFSGVRVFQGFVRGENQFSEKRWRQEVLNVIRSKAALL